MQYTCTKHRLLRWSIEDLLLCWPVLIQQTKKCNKNWSECNTSLSCLFHWKKSSNGNYCITAIRNFMYCWVHFVNIDDCVLSVVYISEIGERDRESEEAIEEKWWNEANGIDKNNGVFDTCIFHWLTKHTNTNKYMPPARSRCRRRRRCRLRSYAVRTTYVCWDCCRFRDITIAIASLLIHCLSLESENCIWQESISVFIQSVNRTEDWRA